MAGEAADRRGRDWSREEVEATVTDYFAMLLMELRGEPFNKAERNRNLRRLLQDRSHGSVERKHQNISAILIDLGLPYVEGYKPLRNYQQLLREVVEDRLAQTPELETLVRAEVERTPSVPTVDRILRVLVEPPAKRNRALDRVRVPPRPPYPRRVNYLMLEARNTALGKAGERFVLNYEQARLLAQRQDRLAQRVEHVAATRGDGLGFDILSYESDGRERLIEVKTTGFGIYTPFYVTPNELNVSRERADHYHVYRVFEFRRSPQLFTLPGAVDNNCDIEPSEYLARI